MRRVVPGVALMVLVQLLAVHGAMAQPSDGAEAAAQAPAEPSTQGSDSDYGSVQGGASGSVDASRLTGSGQPGAAAAAVTHEPFEAAWPDAEPKKRREAESEGDPAQVRTGVVLTGLAGAGTLAGIIALVASKNATDSCRNCPNSGLGEMIAGVSLLAGSAVLATVGIALWATGDSEEHKASAGPRPVAQGEVRLTIGLGSLGIAGRF